MRFKTSPYPRKQASAPKTSWEPVANWYHKTIKDDDSYQNALIFPNTISLLDPKPGKSYLDIACGDGLFAQQLVTKERTAHVVGFDASQQLVQLAQKRRLNQASFLVGDARQFPTQIHTQRFDGATCILAIQNIDKFEAVIAEASRALNSGARFVIVLNHPAFRIPRQSSWGWDEGKKLQYRRIDSYLSTFEIPINAHPGASPSVKTFSYHRPISTYVQTLTKNGFLLAGMEEWISHHISKPGGRSRAENRARQEIPLFLALVGIKK